MSTIPRRFDPRVHCFKRNSPSQNVSFVHWPWAKTGFMAPASPILTEQEKYNRGFGTAGGGGGRERGRVEDAESERERERESE